MVFATSASAPSGMPGRNSASAARAKRGQALA